MINENILLKLEQHAVIIRKYDLGDENYFYSKFPEVNKADIEVIWNKTMIKIRNREIIKTSDELNQTELIFVRKRFWQFENNAKKLYEYLFSEFDYKNLKLDDEKIERKFRNLIANKFLELNFNEIKKELKKNAEIIKLQKKDKESKIINFIVFILIMSFFFGSSIYRIGLTVYDGLTPVETLTERIHERSKYKFNGSFCNDGSISHSQGQGSCSWHDGVNYKFYEGDYAKSIDECKIEAIKSSWIDDLFTDNPFDGINWVGEIKMINSNETWKTRINCKSENEISLYYPNTECSGILQKTHQIDNKIYYREKLDAGQNICTNKGQVIIEIRENDLIFYYCWPYDSIIVARGILKKEK